jgi:hypothetical protein
MFLAERRRPAIEERLPECRSNRPERLSVLLCRTLSGISPKVNGPFLCIAIDLVQL